MEEFISLGHFGIVMSCPSCNQRLWINDSWPGMPFFSLPPLNCIGKSANIVCPKCKTVFYLSREEQHSVPFKVNIVSLIRKKCEIVNPACYVFDSKSFFLFLESFLFSYVSQKDIKEKGSFTINHVLNQEQFKDSIRLNLTKLINSNSIPIQALRE